MTTTNANSCPSDDAVCCSLPSEFVRPRFFYGQRLGVVDFADWLWYHGGKQRFHNLRLHGQGVLCGLGAERYEIPEQDETTVLRLRRGAALDGCGREVVVGFDQCIDVAAWFLQNRDRPELEDWLEAGDLRLCVGLRYLECPSDPAPAPRDPCGCDDGGCEYARVREGFQLDLFTPAEVEAMPATPPWPPPEALDTALAVAAAAGEAGTDAAREALGRALHLLLAGQCPPPAHDPWLWLACFEVTLDGDQITNLVPGSLDNALAERRSLLSTAALQSLLLSLAADAAGTGAFAPGPRLGGMSFDGVSDEAGKLVIDLELASEPDGSGPTLLAEGTFDPSFVHVVRLDPSGVWQTAAPDAAIYDAAGPNLTLKWNSGLKEGLHRFTLAPPPETPIVDQRMQPLRPLPAARHFRLEDQGGTLVLAVPA